jgi:hypothetical protein
MPPESPQATQRTYTTKFPLVENPVSEGGNWINGGVAGLDWTNVRTASGLAWLRSGSGSCADDSTAVLAGPGMPSDGAGRAQRRRRLTYLRGSGAAPSYHRNRHSITG